MATTTIPDTALPAAPPVSADLDPDIGLLLLGELRLNLAALGIDGCTPDFDQVLIQLTADNEPYEFELAASGELVIIPPMASESGVCKSYLCAELAMWRRAHGGVCYWMRCAYRLPSGALLMPNASWITQERHNNLTRKERDGAINGAPDFVAEVLAPYDTATLPQLLARMTEWLDGGAKLGWLVAVRERRAYIYRAGQDEPEILDNPETLSGEDVLPGFLFEVRRLIFDLYGKETEE